MLRTLFYGKLTKKVQDTQRVPFVLRKAFRSSDIACWAIEKLISYILRKADFIRKMRILKQSHRAEKHKRGVLSPGWLQKIKKPKRGRFGDIKTFGKKVPQCRKNQ